MSLHYRPEEVKQQLVQKFERLPVWRGLTRGDTEEIARLYQYLREAEISRRYFQWTAIDESSHLVSYQVFDQEISFLENCANTALLFHYAGEDAISTRYFDLFITEAISLTALSLTDYHLVHTACQVFFFLGNDSVAQRYLNALKPIVVEMHRSHAEAAAENPDISKLELSIDWHAIELTLETKRTNDYSRIDLAIQLLEDSIHQEYSYPASTGHISDFDVLNFIMLEKERMHNGEQGNRLFLLETEPDVEGQIRKIYEEILPKIGLDWVLGERLGRLYSALGNIAVAGGFFKRAAKMKQEIVDTLKASRKKGGHNFGQIESYLHTALLYEYAGEEQLKRDLLNIIEQDLMEWYTWNRQSPHDVVEKYQVTRLVVQYSLLSKKWDLAIEASNWLVDVPLTEKQILAGIVLTIQKVNRILFAYQAGDIERANLERAQLQALIKTVGRPVDTIYHFSEQDYLFLLEKLFPGFTRN